MRRGGKANDIFRQAELTKFWNTGTFQKIICLHFHHFVCTIGILTPADFGWACIEQMRTPWPMGVAFRHYTSLHKHFSLGNS